MDESRNGSEVWCVSSSPSLFLPFSFLTLFIFHSLLLPPSLFLPGLMNLPIKSPPETAFGARKARYRIEAMSISYELPAGNASYRTILNNISFEACPGELLAIAGPSGAGKSSLLSIIAGVIDPQTVAGAIHVNGRAMDASTFRRVSGYITQDDSLFPMLTVEESVSYSARLRLGASRQDATVRARAVLAQLGLVHIAGSRVGKPGFRGISGGERRRVSIGVELVHDPAVLLLDEPTSGLDSASALHIVTMLKSMAVVGGKTVVLTIHQPAFRILDLIDRVVLISSGVVRHQGPLPLLEQRLKECGHIIPLRVNLLEYAIEAMESLNLETIGQESCYRAPCLISRQDTTEGSSNNYSNSRINEMQILAERFSKNIFRTKQLFAARMIQSAVAGIGLGTIFLNVTDTQAKVGFFAFSLTFLLSSTTEGLPIFLQERRILMREASRGAYRVSSYVAANFLVFLPYLLTSALLYSAPAYWLVGLRKELNGFLLFSLVVWLVMLMSNAFVACFGALAPNYIMGNSIVAGLMGSFFLFSGYFISKQSLPRYWIFMHYLSLFKYPYEVFLLNEYGGEKGMKECIQRVEGGCVLDGGMLLKQQGIEGHKWSNLGVMLGFITLYRLLSFVILWIKSLRVAR